MEFRHGANLWLCGGSRLASAAKHRIAQGEPQLSPPGAGCPHPSRCGAAPHRATFPKGKAQAVEKVLRSRAFSFLCIGL